MILPLASRHTFVALVILLFAVGGAHVSAGQHAMPRVQRAIESSHPSIVLVTSSVQEGDSEYFCSAHTGFFVDTKGRVLTSIYAVAGCGAGQVHTADGQKTEARVLAVEQSCGVALLDTGLENTCPLELAEEGLAPGDWVVSALAQDAGEAAPPVTYVLGLVMSSEGSLDLWGLRHKNLIVSNLPMAQGAAGAPLLNSEGRLVGTVLAYGYGRDCRSACYALRTERLSEVLETLRSGGRRLGWLGLTLTESPGKEGHEVGAVLEDCPADAAGIKPGDVLLAIDGQSIKAPSVLVKQIVNSRPGTTLDIKMLRDGKVKTVRATVSPRPLLISRKRPGISEPTAVLREDPPPQDTNARMRNRLRAFAELKRQNEILRNRLRELQQQLDRLRNEQQSDQ